MADNGTWVRALDGRYIFDQGDGWFFDHDAQAWHFADVPAHVPLETSAMTRRRLWRRVSTDWPSGLDAFWSRGCTIPQAIFCWLLRGGIVYALYRMVVLTPDAIRGRHALFNLDGEYYPPAQAEQGTKALTWFMYLAIIVFILLLLFVFETWARDPAKGAVLMAATVAVPILARTIANQKAEQAYWRHHPPQAPGTQNPFQV